MSIIRSTFSFLMFFAALKGFSVAQGYYTDKAPNSPGNYRITSHKTSTDLPRADNTKAIQMMDAVVDIFKKAYPQLMGADIGLYGGIWEDYIAGETFYSTPKIGKQAFDISPGVDVNAKGQLFITFEGSAILDGGFLWEAEIDLKGLGKPAELKQNFTWAVNKGFTAEGQLTSLADKIFDIPPEKQVNKNLKIYKPDH